MKEGEQVGHGVPTPRVLPTGWAKPLEFRRIGHGKAGAVHQERAVPSLPSRVVGRRLVDRCRPAQQLLPDDKRQLGADLDGTEGGAGFDDLLSAPGSPLASRITKQFHVAMTAVQAIPPPLRKVVVYPQAMAAAFDAIKGLLILLKVDMTNMLGVTVDFSDSNAHGSRSPKTLQKSSKNSHDFLKPLLTERSTFSPITSERPHAALLHVDTATSVKAV